MLMRKISRHEPPASSSPPSTGPAASPMLPDAVHRPMAFSRSDESCCVAWLMRESEQGSMTAAPSPCRARAATSATTPGARPQSAEASAKSPTPARYMRRAPYRSPRKPPTSSITAKTSA